MKQQKLLKKLYQALLIHDDATVIKLKQKEFEKIFKRKEKGKQFTSSWTILK